MPRQRKLTKTEQKFLEAEKQARNMGYGGYTDKIKILREWISDTNKNF